MRSLARTAWTIIGAGWLLTALLAFALRLAIPAGFMPAHSADGWTITICTGQGPAVLTVDRDSQPVQPESSICPYALLANPLSAAPPLMLAVLILFVMSTGLRIRPNLRVDDTVRWRPPAHAPPPSVA